MEPVIKAVNVSKTFKNKTVLSGVNLEIEKGKSYGFVGYNGCGKSVLFKLLTGLSLPTSGEVWNNGKCIGADIDYIQDAGVVIESPEFLPYYSGYKNLKTLAEIKNEITDDDIYAVLKQVKLYDDRDKKVKAYSQGMKQRLRIAQAIMEKPETLILDEPMNYLDKEGVALVRSVLQEFSKSGGTLLITSHNKDDIDLLCGEVYEVDGGAVTKLEKGTQPEEEKAAETK